jgi:porin
MKHVASPRSLFLLLSTAPLLAQEQQSSSPGREWIGGEPFTNWTHATGDWNGYRTYLEDLGIEVAGGFTGDFAGALAGGQRRRTSFSTLFDVNAAFDLEKLAGLPRTIAYIDSYQIEGRDPSSDVGDAQGLSNIQADDVREIAEVWVETWIGDEVRLKVGKVDFNSEFAFNEIGGELVNSSAAITPCIVGYPTYPDPAMSINAFYLPTSDLYFGFGIYDGAAAEGVPTGRMGPGGFFGTDDHDAYFLAAEVGKSWTGGDSWGSGRIAAGLWHHTAKFTTFGGGTDSGTSGLWLTVEQNMWRENPTDAADRRGIGAFVSLGIADEDVSAYADTFVCGIAWNGPLEYRRDDVLSFGILHANLSNEAGAGTPNDETAFELLYKLQLTPAISVKPDLQYILNPGGVDGEDDALVALLRFEVLF